MSEQPVIGISINTELPGKRSVVFQTHVPQDCSKADLNALTDKLHDSADRQFSRYLLEILHVELEQHEKLLADQATRIQVVEKNIQAKSMPEPGRRNGREVDVKELREKEQAYTNLDACKERVAMIQQKIAEHQKVVQG